MFTFLESWMIDQTQILRETTGKNSPLNRFSQPILVNRTHARSGPWLWQDFEEGDLEDTGRDRLMEQPLREVL